MAVVSCQEKRGGDVCFMYAISEEVKVMNIIRKQFNKRPRGQDTYIEIPVKIQIGTDSNETRGRILFGRKGSTEPSTVMRDSIGNLERQMISLNVKHILKETLQRIESRAGRFVAPAYVVLDLETTDLNVQIYSIAIPSYTDPERKLLQKERTLEPMDTSRVDSHNTTREKILILDGKWKEQLIRDKKVFRLRSVGVSEEILEALRHELPSFVDKGECSNTCVAVISTTRVQSDAEMALQRLGIGPGEGAKTTLLMLHKVAGSTTKDDVLGICYRNETVFQTVHVPFKKCS